jgi:hypothetical protein
MNPNIQKAYKVSHYTADPRWDYMRRMEELDKRGLLMTPEAEACVKACEAMRRVVICVGLLPESAACRAAGLASLAAKKPKERWQPKRWKDDCGPWGVWDAERDMLGGNYPSEAHARAAAEALNRVERGE